MSEEDNVSRPPDPSGGYEVWFLTFTDPTSGRGYWIRSTASTRGRDLRSAGVWFARFDPADPSDTFGIHRTWPGWQAEPGRFDVRIGDAVMTSGVARGRIAGGGHDVGWDLSYPTGGPTFRVLPGPLYRGGIVPTKPLSPNVDTRVSGTVTVDGEIHELRGVPAQQGHVMGRRHAERWAWAHCGDFVGEDAVVEAVIAQSRRGPFLTPYATFVGVRFQGRWIRLRKIRRRRDFSLGSWRVDLESRTYRLAGRIEAPATALLRARYEDPDGTPRYCHNSEIASCRLALFERRPGGFEEVALLESRGTTHAEWAGRTPAPQVKREFTEVSA